MKERIYLVTAANGHTGYTVAKELLARGHHVRAMVRNIESDQAVSLKGMGADIFRGNLDDFRDVKEAVRGTDRAYFCAPFEYNALIKSVNFIIAAEQEKLNHVVYMTQWLLSPAHPAIHTREQWLAKQMALLHRNVGYTFINPGLFGFTYFFTLEMVTQLGLYPTLIPKAKLDQVGLNAPPSEQDQGRVIAEILLEPAAHQQKTYRITGPKLISHRDVIDTYEKVLGRSITPMVISKKMLFKSLKAMGFPPYQFVNLNHYLDELANGVFSLDGGVTQVVRSITGSDPEDFETILRREVERSGLGKRTVTSKLKALMFFFKIILTKAPNLDAYVKQQQFPSFFNKPLYVYQNEAWKSEHKLQLFDLK